MARRAWHTATTRSASACRLRDTAASADDAIVTKAALCRKRYKAVPPQPATCSSPEDFVATNCPLTWNGITLYGTIDAGVSWRSHGAPFNGTSAPGVDYLIQKYSNHPRWDLGPNGRTQLKHRDQGEREPFAPGCSLLSSTCRPGFDPYSLHICQRTVPWCSRMPGCRSTNQTSGSDSSRAGQFYNSVGYLGVSSYGTLTVFRQNTLTLDAVFAYDPMSASIAFSPIGWQGITCGVGDTEDCRFSTSVKYHVDIGQFRVAALWQFGG